MLEVKDIDTFYGLSHILQGVSLRIEEGEAVALLGRNGAGKTTTLKSIMGLLTPRRGLIAFKGREIAGLPPYEVLKLGIGYIPEDRRIFPNLTVLENLKMGHLASGKGERLDAYLDMTFSLFPPLKRLLKQKGKSLSGGEQQMLTMARGLGSSPDLLLIDEPTEGLMPKFVETIADTLVEFRKRKIGFILVEQRHKMALDITQRVYLIEKGIIRWEGTSEELKAQPEIRLKYLGV
jgi:branched-chain amino acid transport system ATP-binding protein